MCVLQLIIDLFAFYIRAIIFLRHSYGRYVGVFFEKYIVQGLDVASFFLDTLFWLFQHQNAYNTLRFYHYEQFS